MTEETSSTPMTESKDHKTIKPAKNSSAAKVKLALDLPDCHPFVMFANEVKKRKIKDIDLNEAVGEALMQVPEGWWEKYLEQITPLEYRIQAALSDPDLRGKLEAMLVSGDPDRTH